MPTLRIRTVFRVYPARVTSDCLCPAHRFVQGASFIPARVISRRAGVVQP